MKQNLLKILAIAAMTLSLASCGSGETSESSSESESTSEVVEVETVTISGLMSIGSDGEWEYLGQRVAVSDVMTVAGYYGNHYFLQMSEPVSRLYGVEAEVSVDPGFTSNGGYGSAVYVEGTVSDVGGRMVLTDAVLTIYSEYVNGSGGGHLYYYSNWGRSSWDGSLDRTFSSMIYRDTFALATVPGTITTDSDAYFYVTFPGEDPDPDFSSNYSLIRVYIPSGLTEAAVNSLNSFFSYYEVGDFVYLTSLFYYDEDENYGMGLILENIWGRSGISAGSASVYTTFADAAATVQDYYAETIPDFENELIFSWTVNSSYITNGYTAADLYDSPYVTNPEDCYFVQFQGNAKSENIDSVATSAETVLKDAGYSVLYSYASAGYTFATLTVNGEVTSQVLVMAESTYITIQYVAEMVVTAVTYATEDEAWADVNARYAAVNATYGSVYFPATSTSAPTLASCGGALPTSVTVDESTANMSSYMYLIELVYEFTSSVIASAQIELYTAALEADSNYQYAFFYTLSSTYYGYYNYSTGEFIMVSVYGNYMIIDIYEMYYYNDSVYPIFDTDTEAFAFVEGLYADIAEAYPDYFGSAPCTTGLPDFDDNGLAGYSSIGVYSTDTYLTDYADDAAIYYVRYNVNYSNGEDTSALASAYVDALADSADWAYMYNQFWQRYGYWNETTGEFVVVSAASSGTAVYVYVYFMPTFAEFMSENPLEEATEQTFTTEEEGWAYVNEIYGMLNGGVYSSYFPGSETAALTLSEAGCSTAVSSVTVTPTDASSLAMYMITFTITFDEGVDASAEAETYLAAIAASDDWTYVYNAAYEANGWFCYSTGEFILVSGSDNVLTITIIVMYAFIALGYITDAE